MHREAADMLDPRWRARLAASLGWMLAVKLAALALLWVLFFAPARITPTAAATGARFGLDGGRRPADAGRAHRPGGAS